MHIISIPHQTLRSQTVDVIEVDKKLKHFLNDLESTLFKKDNPKGVGLAAPQVDRRLRIFTTQLPTNENPTGPSVIKSYINPKILDHSENLVLDHNKKEPRLEGCLSIPKIYGPVPRWEWLDLEYQTVVGDELVSRKEHFADFAARVVQHEYDHLFGKLFIDYTLVYDLPLYQEDQQEDLVPLSPEIIAALVAESQGVS
jgi:peptide deformylase